MRRFYGNNAALEVTFAPIATAGRGNGDALLERVEGSFFGKFLDKGLTTSLEEFDIAFTIVAHVVLKDKVIVLVAFGGLPLEKVATFGWGHAVGIVVVCVGKRTLVVLIGTRVEEVRKIPFAEFAETKRLGEGSQWKWQETEGIFKGETIGGEREYFGANGDEGVNGAMCVVTVLEEKHAVIAFEVVKESDDLTITSILVDG